MTLRLDGGSLRGRLVVSCQAAASSPLDDPKIIAALAEAAVVGGAGGVRINGPDHIRAVRAAVSVPIIGLLKRRIAGSSVFITPTLDDALAVVVAGADLVAIDATLRPRPDGSAVREIMSLLHAHGVGVVADVDCLEAGVVAVQGGADFVASTLAGYTSGGVPSQPDIELVRTLARAMSAPVIAEGRYHQPAQVGEAFEAGAYAVVVGAAITNPTALTRSFVAVTPGSTAEVPGAPNHMDEG